MVIILATGSKSTTVVKPLMELLLFLSTPVVQWLSYSPLDAGSMDFFQSVKILSMTSFGREVKPWVACRRFTARKRTSSRN